MTDDMKTCPICGKCWIKHEPTMTGLGFFFSPPGHDHDDNCVTRVYECENQHRLCVSRRNRCPVEGCGWIGRDDCKCHDGKKIDEWPEVRR